MAVTQNKVVTPQAIQNDVVQLSNGTGACGTGWTNAPTNTVQLLTAGTNGLLVKSIVVSSDDTSGKALMLYLSLDAGATKYAIGAVTVPTNSGQTGSAPTIDLLAGTILAGFPQDQTGKFVLELAPNARLYVGVQTAVTAGKFINVVAQSEAL